MAIRMEAISRSHWGCQEQTPYMFPYDHLTRCVGGITIELEMMAISLPRGSIGTIVYLPTFTDQRLYKINHSSR